MAKPKLSSKTPDATDTSSLIDDHEMIIEHFNSREHPNRHIALVEFGATGVLTLEGGAQQATIVVRAIEVLKGKDADAGEKLFTNVYRGRTGNKERPDLTAVPDTPLEGMDDPELDDGVE